MSNTACRLFTYFGMSCVKNRSKNNAKKRTNDGCPKKDANSHSSSVTTTTDKNIRRKSSAKPKLKNKTDSRGLKHTLCIKKPETAQTLAQHCEWKRMAKTNSALTLLDPHYLPAINTSVKKPTLPCFNIENAEIWNILQPRLHNFAPQAERTYYKPCLRKMFDHTPCSPFKKHPTSTGDTQRDPHELQKAQKRQQPQCTPRRRLVNTSCGRRRWLSKPSVSTFVGKRNAWMDRISFICTTNVSQASKTEAPTSPCEIHILKMATLWIGWWTIKGTLMNRPPHDTTQPWKQAYDGNLNMNGHLGRQRCRDLPDCHSVRLIDLSFVPKQARFAECDELSSTPEENMNIMCSGNIANLFRQRLSSVKRTWSTNPEVKHTQQHDVLMMRSKDVGKARWNETFNICGEAQRSTTHSLTKLSRPLQTTMKRQIRIQLVRDMKPITTNKNTMQSSQEQTNSTIKKHTYAGTQRFSTPKVVSE